MSNHVNSLLFTPFAGLLNLGKRLGVPETVLAPALRGAAVPEVYDLSKAIEAKTREACGQINPRMGLKVGRQNYRRRAKR